MSRSNRTWFRLAIPAMLVIASIVGGLGPVSAASSSGTTKVAVGSTATGLVFTPVGGIIGPANTLNRTNTSFTVTATAPAKFGSLGGTAELLMDSVSFAPPVTTVMASGSTSIVLSPGFTTAAAVKALKMSTRRSLTIRLTDRAGNIAPSSALAITVNDAPPAPAASVTGDAAFPFAIYEGNSVHYTVSVSGVSVGSPLFWVMRATTGTATSADFSDATLDGSFLLSASGTTVITRTWANDQTTEGNETWVTDIRNGSTTGPVIGTSGAVTIYDSSVAPSATITKTRSAINEGETVAYTIKLAGAVNVYPTVYWSMRTTGTGTTLSSDFTDGTLSGNFRVGSTFVSQEVTRTWANDLTTEGPETWVMDLRTGSTTGPVIGTSEFITVADSSPAPIATITRNTPSITEGAPVTFTITVSGTTGAAASTVYWVMRETSGGSASASDFTDNLLGGSYTVSAVRETSGGSASASDFTDNLLGGSYTVSAGLIDTVTRSWANDLTTEGPELWVMDIRTGSTTGPVIGTSEFITVADSSPAPVATITRNTPSIIEGAPVTFTITVSGTTGAAGSTLYWVMRAASGASASDFTDNLLGGNYSVSAGLVDTVTRTWANDLTTWANDLTTEGPEPWVMEIRTGSTTGPVIGTSGFVTVTDTSEATSATISPSGETVNEGSIRAYTITTLNVRKGTPVYWKFRATQGTLNPGNLDTGDQGDFMGGQYSGYYICPANGVQTVTVGWRNDLFTEGTEVYVVDVKLGSTNGTVIGTGGTTTVQDTSHR
ncbi:MAG: hypothetical protein NTV35_03695 [Chloroflexi bacterium]|nr:hypothetical protein [Chloroflexota bacterium]